MDEEMKRFQGDLIESVHQMKGNQAARETQVPLTMAAEARRKVGMSQKDFADLPGVSVRTLQDWKQGRREPSGAARTLLRVATKNPQAIHDAA